MKFYSRFFKVRYRFNWIKRMLLGLREPLVANVCESGGRPRFVRNEASMDLGIHPLHEKDDGVTNTKSGLNVCFSAAGAGLRG